MAESHSIMPPTPSWHYRSAMATRKGLAFPWRPRSKYQEPKHFLPPHSERLFCVCIPRIAHITGACILGRRWPRRSCWGKSGNGVRNRNSYTGLCKSSLSVWWEGGETGPARMQSLLASRVLPWNSEMLRIINWLFKNKCNTASLKDIHSLEKLLLDDS